MKVLLDPEDIDRIASRIALVYAQRMVAVLDDVPLESPDQRVTDAGFRNEWIRRTMAKAEREHPLPSWRDLL